MANDCVPISMADTNIVSLFLCVLVVCPTSIVVFKFVEEKELIDSASFELTLCFDENEHSSTENLALPSSSLGQIVVDRFKLTCPPSDLVLRYTDTGKLVSECSPRVCAVHSGFKVHVSAAYAEQRVKIMPLSKAQSASIGIEPSEQPVTISVPINTTSEKLRTLCLTALGLSDGALAGSFELNVGEDLTIEGDMTLDDVCDAMELEGEDLEVRLEILSSSITIEYEHSEETTKSCVISCMPHQKIREVVPDVLRQLGLELTPSEVILSLPELGVEIDEDGEETLADLQSALDTDDFPAFQLIKQES